ncbi:LysR family transcriptional regulator [Streptoalloteichus tenebrarius]|uniref:LysR family transcriptional regulator n=1 Tax=Streptoalloteichus tenebrarius (strain ATCC 17920 / DSM 40477 / JCM 4838 / CBS 697.72 / NBRC 16177 / NCIMB 11028 / NRRL B-12390 / A12253. 1 / ISP 5477) TaxID=1933 RepID=UPI0020A34320|nr:LysR family transcriptional regulator [Streptoalloteichus tenebrarius]BFF01053.1 LysR family transcriptional regulator [Streptoalloteichus tenebrarius]
MLNERAEALATGLAPRLTLLRELGRDPHITRVAERLGIPQPTVSRWLAALGEELGTPVVVRVGRRVQLTRAGRFLADAAEHALAAVTSGYRRAVEEADPGRGHVSLAFLHTLGQTLVPHLVQGFRERFPQVRFALVQGSHEGLLDRLRLGEVDLVLTSPPPTDSPDFAAAPLHEEPLVVLVPEHHRLAKRRRVRLVELADEDFVALSPGYGLRQITDALCAKAGFSPRLAFEGEETDTLRGLVAAGLGVTVVCRAWPMPPPGTVELDLLPGASRTIGLVWAADRPLPPSVRAFRDFARQRSRTAQR